MIQNGMCSRKPINYYNKLSCASPQICLLKPHFPVHHNVVLYEYRI